MNKSVKRIVVILIILILLPAAFLTINEIISLQNNEDVIERIYANQLDAILYSVNQYSDDVVNSWASKIDLFLDELPTLNSREVPSIIDSFYSQMPSLYAVFIADSVNDESIELLGWDELENFIQVDENEFNSEIRNLLLMNKKNVNRLIGYKNSGYRKLEPIHTELNGFH